MTTLNGLLPSWASFIQTISGRTKLPKFDRLCANCTQEETKIVARQILHGPQVEENQAFITHTKKGKGKGRKFHKHEHQARRPSSSPEWREKRKDLSHIQCHKCKKYGHYANKCFSANKRKHKASIADVEEGHHHKKQRNENRTEFFFISALSGTIPTTSDTWLIDSGASKHMTGYKENLSEVVEKESHLEVMPTTL